MDLRSIFGPLGLGDVTGVLVQLPLHDWATSLINFVAKDADDVLFGVNMKCDTLWVGGKGIAPDLATLTPGTEGIDEVSKLLLDGEFLPGLFLGLTELFQFTLESVLLRLFGFLGLLGLFLAEFLPFFVNHHLLLKELLLPLCEFLFHLLNFGESDFLSGGSIFWLDVGFKFFSIDA